MVMALPKKDLKAYSNLFGLAEQEENGKEPMETTVQIRQLKPYADHPFKLYEGERLDDMVESIRKNGVLVPIIVRTMNERDFYEILAGHNRVNAAKIAGLVEVPAYIKSGLSDEEAEIYVIETNVMQRSFTDMAHSEKATVLALHHNKMFSQGKRNDILTELQALENQGTATDEATSPQIGAKLRSDEKVGLTYGLSKNSVARYLRINQLIDELKSLVDEGSIPLNAGVSISYLLEDEQMDVYQVLDENHYKVDLIKADLLKNYSEKKKLKRDEVVAILSGSMTKKVKNTGIKDCKVKKIVLEQYFEPETSPKEIEETIQKALALYFADSSDAEE